jgi:SAM-dependent methyltransferase
MGKDIVKTMVDAGYKKVWEDPEVFIWKAIADPKSGEPGFYYTIHKATKTGLGHYETLKEALDNLDADKSSLSEKLGSSLSPGFTYYGERKPGKKVLDLGAGYHPDSRATSAIDKDVTAEEMASLGLDYKGGIDLSKDSIPYPDGSFDMVVSHGALGWNFGGKGFGESKRVLKPGGQIELEVNDTNLEGTREALSGVGFCDIKVGYPRGSSADRQVVTARS